MESDHEQSVIALKSFLHNLGFDKKVSWAHDWSEQKQYKSCSVENQLEFVQIFEMHYNNHGISYARKAMVRMGMSLSYNPGTGESTKWEEAQFVF